MLETYFSNKNSFNILFCKYRIRNYFNETADFLTRHKLLLAFIICLLVPGVHNLPKIGIPFFEIINPLATIQSKLLCLGIILAFSLMLTNAQSNFIKGGKLRNYLNTFDISAHTHKKIDLMILAISLNFIWVAIVLGAGFIYSYSQNIISLFSLFCLYVSFIFSYLVLLLSHLYRNKKYMFLLFVNLIFIACIPLLTIPFANYTGSILGTLFSLFIFRREIPSGKENTSNKRATGYNKQLISNSLRRYFTIQLATYKQHREVFLTKALYCTIVNIFLVYLVMIQNLNIDHIGIFMAILGFSIYILCTLFSVFQQDEKSYKLFHTIFPYQSFLKYVKEITLTFLIFLIAGLPLLFYLAIENENLFIVIFTAFLMSFIPLTINRIFYWLSLRFCFFTSLINSILWMIAQYWILGGIFEY
ncbi:hypothetical protein [Legionella longbeachae]|uniref:hypothetical protein n=1 Tax=Legionella longbeachae TaxID=450 RepID=UPI0014047DA5|nr:hypothetical protein [Legionella longbeachae]QIN36832.1 hypothetical protein GCS73_14900 [Legionella longbeachae]